MIDEKEIIREIDKISSAIKTLGIVEIIIAIIYIITKNLGVTLIMVFFGLLLTIFCGMKIAYDNVLSGIKEGKIK